jgi:hypothetical protein
MDKLSPKTRSFSSSFDILENNKSLWTVESPFKITEMPEEFKGKHRNSSVVIIGAGNLYKRYSGGLSRVLHHLLETKVGNIRIYDPKYLGTTGIMNMRSDSLIDPVTSSLNAIKKDSVALILSPNQFHLSQIKALANNPNIKGIYCEKPMVINQSELVQLDKVLKTTDKPVCFGDHYYFKKLALLSLMGVPVPYKNLLDIELDETNGKISECMEKSKPILGKITSIKARKIENGSPTLLNRTWLQNKAGGGVLLDLGVHIFDVNNLLGLNVKNIDSVDLKKYPFVGRIDKSKGVFREMGSQEVEDYARITGTATGGAKFDYEMTAYGLENTDYLLLEDENNFKLRIPSDNARAIEYLDNNNKVIGRVSMKVNNYMLIFDHILSYFNSKKDNTSPLFYNEQKDSILLIEKIKRIFESSIKRSIKRI